MNKKVIIGLTIVVLILLSILGIATYKYVDIINENNKIKKNISNINNDVDNITNNINSTKEDMHKLADELKDKIEEYNTWRELKENIESILN